MSHLYEERISSSFSSSSSSWCGQGTVQRFKCRSPAGDEFDWLLIVIGRSSLFYPQTVPWHVHYNTKHLMCCFIVGTCLRKINFDCLILICFSWQTVGSFVVLTRHGHNLGMFYLWSALSLWISVIRIRLVGICFSKKPTKNGSTRNIFSKDADKKMEVVGVFLVH